LVDHQLLGLGRTWRYNARSGRGVLNSSGHGVRPASSAATFLPARRQRLGRAGVSRRALLTELNHGNSITSVVRLPSPGSRLRGEHRAPHDLSLATPLPRRGSRLRRQLGQFSRAGAGQFSRAPKAWRKRWEEIVPFLHFPPEMRRAIYTTNAIEALNRQVRKIIKTRGAFPTDDAALKLVFLALRNAQKTWGRPFPQFAAALAQF